MKTMMLITTLTLASAASAQEAPRRISITVDVKATAAEQLKSATELMRNVDVAPNDAERQRAIGIALMHLEAVPTRWPGDTRAVAEAYALQYDLTMRSQMPMNAAEIMEKAERLPLSPSEKASIARRKAVALSLSGRTADAEKAFASAEQAQQHATAFERQALLQDRARFAAAQGRSGEAAKYLRKLVQLPSTDVVTRMTAMLQSLEHSIAANDRNGARADYRELQRLYDDAKSKTSAGDGDVVLLKIVAEALQRHRDV